MVNLSPLGVDQAKLIYTATLTSRPLVPDTVTSRIPISRILRHAHGGEGCGEAARPHGYLMEEDQGAQRGLDCRVRMAVQDIQRDLDRVAERLGTVDPLR